MWMDIACIVFVCVTVNHLGLVKAVEDVIGRSLPVVNCVKCLTFWTTLLYCGGKTAEHGLPAVLAISFLASYMAIWLELIEGSIDTLYLKMYGKIYGSEDGTTAPDPYAGYPDGTVPELQQEKNH